MKDFKKRALILTLAATISVTGSFAADNYKNCLMNMEFVASGDKEVNLILNTKSPYEGTISPIRKDASTFIIMLPEVDNVAPTPDLSETNQFIQSVEIRKMPYANGSKGYTKILVKTSGLINLNTSTALYIPSGDIPMLPERTSTPEDNIREIRENNTDNESTHNHPVSDTVRGRYNNGRVDTSSEPERRREYHSEPEPEPEQTSMPNDSDESEPAANEQPQEPTTASVPNESSHQQYLLGLLVLFIILTSVYFYMKAQDKLTNVMGEKLNIEVDEEPKEKKKKVERKRKIKNTINKLNSEYPKPSPQKITSYMKDETDSKQASEEDDDEMNVVDLDELFKEKQAKADNPETEQTISDALDDFLSGFEFNDEDFVSKIENEEEYSAGYDEELYDNLINNKKIRFSKEDIECFNELLQSEISDNVIQNIEKFAVSNPIKREKPSKEKILERLVTDYAISQNITFTSEDIEALRKIISVEIDENFLKDWRTNPDLTNSMAKSISDSDYKRHKPSEIVTLNVKDMLPNLSKELKKQGRKPIASEAKPETVFYSEGYEVSTLSLDYDLPDLSKELKNKHAYDSKPSHVMDTVDTSYSDSVEKLKISGLPDMKDVIAHPDKYKEKPKKEFVPDEKALLNSIMNVEFKPFDDGTRKFEIINDFEEEEEKYEPQPVVDIEKEFSQFSNFEVANTDEPEKEYVESDYDDFEALYSNDFVDLDAETNKEDNQQNPTEQTEVSNSLKPQETIPEQTEKISKKPKNILKNFKSGTNKEGKVKFIPQNLERTFQKLPKRSHKEKSEKLLQMLDKIRSERKQTIAQNKDNPKKKPLQMLKQAISPKAPALVKCILEGVNYDIVASAAITGKIGCHLAKSDKGYKVLAYHDTELSVLKEYDALNNERIQIRQSETLSDGTPRYLIRVAQYKFIVDVKDNQIKYVMDLC